MIGLYYMVGHIRLDSPCDSVSFWCETQTMYATTTTTTATKVTHSLTPFIWSIEVNRCVSCLKLSCIIHVCYAECDILSHAQHPNTTTYIFALWLSLSFAEVKYISCNVLVIVNTLFTRFSDYAYEYYYDNMTRWFVPI